jgi:NitT/TauT family transport system ATP-binding protein
MPQYRTQRISGWLGEADNRPLSDRIMLTAGSADRCARFLFQYRRRGKSSKSQAAWLYSQMLRGIISVYNAEDQLRAEQVFRPNVYRIGIEGTSTRPFPVQMPLKAA